MSLVDVEPLLSLPRETWRALGRRLDAIGLDADAAAPFLRMVGNGSPQRAPIAKWNLRRTKTAAGYAMRMFIFDDPVTPDEARAALGDELSLEQLIEIGALHRAHGGIVSSFPMGLLSTDDFCCRLLCDDLNLGGQAVMGPSKGTRQVVEMACPSNRAARALDLGCGAGTIALMLSKWCDHVVATDVNPRAIALARINAWVHGIENVEFRIGELFEPVEGETFDLIASQPPFVPRPPDTPPSAFLFGGERGDELPLALLQKVPPHLDPAGRAFVMVEWPEIVGEPSFGERLRVAVGPDSDVLLLQKSASDLDEHCTHYARVGLEPARGAAYEHAVMRYREHLERLGVRALHTTYVVVRRRAGTSTGWTSTLPWKETFGDAEVTRASVEGLLQREDRRHDPAASVAPSRAKVSDPPPEYVLSMLAVAENHALAGRTKEALTLFGHVLQADPTCTAAILGVASIEIAAGGTEAPAARLAGLAQLGDHEARRLLGDVHWIRGEIQPALLQYSVGPRPGASIPASVTRAAIDVRVDVNRRSSQKRPFLVWVTCPTLCAAAVGRWFRPDRARRWDLAVNCYAPDPGDGMLERPEHIVYGGASKLSSVKASFLAAPDLFDGYLAMLFLDDDIGLRHDDVDRLFWLMSRYRLDLAHPSFSEDSICNLAPMFHQREVAARFTSIVDTRAPAFSRDGFVSCLDSFDQSISGRGLGHVWSHLLRHRRQAVGVIDEVIAQHHRPVDVANGPFYRHLRTLGVDPDREALGVVVQYGCPAVRARTDGDIDRHGRERHHAG